MALNHKLSVKLDEEELAILTARAARAGDTLSGALRKIIRDSETNAQSAQAAERMARAAEGLERRLAGLTEIADMVTKLRNSASYERAALEALLAHLGGNDLLSAAAQRYQSARGQK